jgi:hypothetical protein
MAAGDSEYEGKGRTIENKRQYGKRSIRKRLIFGCLYKPDPILYDGSR